MAYRDVVLADTPIEYWEFNEASGTTADSVGSGNNDATHTGTTVSAGRVGNARQYDGVDDVTVTPTTLTDFMGGTNFTIEMWVKYDGTYTNDYPTFFRRDGAGKTFLVRTRNPSQTRGHVIETYYNGRTVDTGSTTFNDNQWHHVVVTKSGTTIRLFVDNVEYTTGNGTATTGGSGATTGNIGRGLGAGEYFKGGIDEVAIYNTALSTTRITAHYNAGLPVSVTAAGVTAMTATASTPTAIAIPQKHASYSASPMTASATNPTATAKVIVNRATTLDYSYTDQGNLNPAGAGVLYVIDSSGGSSDGFGVVKFDAVTTAGAVIDSATFSLTNEIAGNAQVRLYPIIADFTGTPTTKASFTLGNGVTVTPSPTDDAVNNFNVASVLSSGTPLYGFFIEPVGQDALARFKTMETSGGGAASFTMTYRNQINNLIVSAEPMLASGDMPDVALDFVTDRSVTAGPMTGSATWVNPNVVVDKDNTFVAEAVVADATMPGGQFSYSTSYVASTMTANASTPSAVASTTIGVKYVAAPMAGTARWVPPASVNDNPIDQNENEDPYYNRVNALKPKYWWRFNDNASVVKDTVTGQTEGTPSGVYRGGALPNQSIAPEARKAVRFPLGAYIEQNEPTATNIDETTFVTGSVVRTVLEFSIKTSKANQFVMAGADQTVGTNGVASTAGATEVFVKNGKLGYRTWSNQSVDQSGLNTITKEFTGFKTVADGEWHHITIRSGIKSGVRDEYGVEIWVDGKMDVRRYFTQSWIGMPDFVGARFANFDSARLPALPLAQYFEGDLAELVWYVDTTHAEDDITRNYYAFMGYRPIDAPAMEATATMTDAKGKGNQKKALYLYWSDQDEVFGGMPGKAGQSVGESISFDPMPNLVNDAYQSSLAPRLSEETGEFFGFKVFTKSITRNYSPLGIISYRDQVTDEQSLIDLTRDVDLSEYDVIMFKDWPDEGYEIDWYEANYPGQRERLLQQLRDANEDGVGLYVTNPRLAIDLGIIDRVEFVAPLTERKVVSGQGRAEGLYDYGSALKFPWNIVSADGLTGNSFAIGIGQEQNTTPSYLESKAHFYYDNNRNNKFRVVSKISGLTDLPSYMLEDAVFHVDADKWGWEGAAYKYLHRMDGLEIGDEYIFHGSPTIDPRWLDSVEVRYLRTNGTWATPPGHVKAGTVVTTFGSKQFVGGVETSNPYQNYATTIVLESGTILNGRSTGGRIFVNFSETPSQGLGMPVQVIPGSQYASNNSEEVDLDADAPVFVINGTPEQKALTQEALARCTFPFGNLQDRVKAKYGSVTTPIIWTDIDPGEETGGLGTFDRDTGVIEIDQDAINTHAAANALDAEDLAMSTIIHELGHLVDYIYLQPYQRVNIWNVFHEDWNVWHEHQGPQMEAYRLQAGYPLDMSTTNIHEGEGWSGGAYKYEKLAEAFAQAFVQAYSDIPVDVFAFVRRNQAGTIIDGHPAPESIGPKIRAAIETGPGAYLFDQNAIESDWPRAYTPETGAQRDWEYSWTRTSLSFTASALKTRQVKVTMPDGSVQNIIQGSTIGTRGDEQLVMARSNQLFPVITMPRLEMTARGIYWLADAEKVAEGSVVVRATPMEANGVAPSASVIAERSNAVLAQPMVANATMTESGQAKSGNATVLVFAMTATGRMSQGSERTIVATPMTATGVMLSAVNKSSGEAITLRLPRPARITLRIKEAV